MKQRMLRGELYLGDDPEIQADAGARAGAASSGTTRPAHVEQRAATRSCASCSARSATASRAAAALGRLREQHLDRRRDVRQLRLRDARRRADPDRRRVQLATRVQLLTATHPIDPEPRRLGWESAAADHDRRQRLARRRRDRAARRDDRRRHRRRRGRVVTRDLPAGVVAVGTPARVLREIGPEDAVAVPSRSS